LINARVLIPNILGEDEMKVIEKKKDKEKVSIALEGDMTIYSVKELKNELSGYFTNIRNMEFDLSKIDTIDTSGFQLLATAMKELEERDKTFSIINPSDDVKRIFKLYGENIK
jgi:anti-anti-sigma factor